MSLKLSTTFSTVLTRISHNKVSEQLLKVSDFDRSKFDYNYIDISKSNKLVSFCPNKKIDKILEALPKHYQVNGTRNLTFNSSNDKIFKALGFVKEDHEYWYPQPGDGTNGEILDETISKSSGNTYCLYRCNTTKRLCVINKEALVRCGMDENSLFKISRNTIKIGRLVTHLLKSINFEFNEKDIEDFVNLYKFSHDFMNNKSKQFELVSGKDIAYWYHYSRYTPGGGMLNNSCMSNKRDFIFDVYTKNSACSMLILYSDDGKLTKDSYKATKIKGRALVWDVEYKGKMIKFMDRVYTTFDSDIELFRQYAKENGWWCKSEQSMYPNTDVTNGKKTTNDRFEVKLDYVDNKFFPYMDTMCYWVDGVLTNSSDKKHTRAFRCTNGAYVICENGRETAYSPGEGEYIEED